MNNKYKVECITKFEGARSYKERIKAYFEYKVLDGIEACIGGYNNTMHHSMNEATAIASMMYSMEMLTLDEFGEIVDCIQAIPHVWEAV